MSTRNRIVLLLLLAAGACERGGGEPPEEVRTARRDATRRACIAAELARDADDKVRTLEETVSSPGTGPAAEITRQAGLAALQFARAYQQHALLRQTAAAQSDSAVNHSGSPEDSARHEQQASLEIMRPEPGSVEANVMVDWERNFASIVADADHPCNWDLAEEGGNS